ncbi:hypothetical protein CERZMDRAFT_88560 [Cercospora zeae-maydis SCOH1-5]|uniref:Uncharacterized protein n=1 Tax=Cercospora zeae-maydis SCOH1-5 TaxID=717836 RepID=A0A6A6F2G2_9PEZI|nr:hypothetical protein CERZMDRAFT_88560 [Cercospora zeae-maydis SCOH1-5]
MAECQRHAPVVVAATKQDAFLDRFLGQLTRERERSKQECGAAAEEGLLEEDRSYRRASHGCTRRVDGRADHPPLTTSIPLLSFTLSAPLVFRDERKLASCLKIHMAVYEVMGHCKLAGGHALKPSSLRGSKDDIWPGGASERR